VPTTYPAELVKEVSRCSKAELVGRVRRMDRFYLEANPTLPRWSKDELISICLSLTATGRPW
jgi:hypothetical protein